MGGGPDEGLIYAGGLWAQLGQGGVAVLLFVLAWARLEAVATPPPPHGERSDIHFFQFPFFFRYPSRRGGWGIEMVGPFYQGR